MRTTMMIGFVAVVLSLLGAPAYSNTHTVPLVAGQYMPVGTVTVTHGAESLTVTFAITEGLCEDVELLETHVHVAWDPALIPQNSKGNPQIGKFEFNGVNPATINLEDVLGTNVGNVIYIAAHAVVGNDFCDICDEVVEGTVESIEIDKPGADSYFDIEIGDGTYPAWCVDYDHYMNLIGCDGEREDTYPFDLSNVRYYAATCAPDFYPLPSYLTDGHGILGGIDREANLDKVLWILNQWHQNHPATWTVPDIQQVIWYLLEGPGDVQLITDIATGRTLEIQQAILAAADAADILPPVCCDYVGVLLAPEIPELSEAWDICEGDPDDDRIRQLAIVLLPAPCCETAWGDAFDGTPFAPANPKNGKRSGSWAVYFSHDLDEVDPS